MRAFPALIWGVATICVLSPVTASASESIFECPDDVAVQLLELALSARDPKHGFKDSISAFSHVIDNADRPMDGVALRTACAGLAHDSYLMEHYGSVGAVDVFGLIPPKEAVASLRELHPILSICPDRSLYQTQLPIRRAKYVPPREAVRLGVTGWVDLELDVDEDGTVKNARIVDSSSQLLEHGVLDHVRSFRYPAKSHQIGYSMVREGLHINITTNYFQIARERGCKWDDPRVR